MKDQILLNKIKIFLLLSWKCHFRIILTWLKNICCIYLDDTFELFIKDFMIYRYVCCFIQWFKLILISYMFYYCTFGIKEIEVTTVLVWILKHYIIIFITPKIPIYSYLSNPFKTKYQPFHKICLLPIYILFIKSKKSKKINEIITTTISIPNGRYHSPIKK